MSTTRLDAQTSLVDRAIGTEAERLSTGIVGLDHLLGGGLLRGNSLLIEGPPGSGKSTLAVRIVHEGIIRQGEPALIIAFEEFPRQIYKEALANGVDLRAHEQAGMLRVLWTSPARVLDGFQNRSDLVGRVIEEIGVRRVVIDSITHFKRIASSEPELRELLSSVLCDLKLKAVTAFLVKETESSEGDDIAFEEYLVDASIRVYHDAGVACPADGARLLEVRKTRGQGHTSGRHPFELGPDGVEVFPRLRPRDIETLLGPTSPDRRQRTTIGVPGLDSMLGGGPWSGSLQLIVGPSGSGKSLLAQQFVDAGLTSGERALFVTLRNAPDEILARARSSGLDWSTALGSGQLRFLHADPTEWSLEKIQSRMLELLAESPSQRLVFDGIDDLRPAHRETDAVRGLLLILSRLSHGRGLTVVTTLEEPDGDVDRAAELRESARAADGVIHLLLHADASGLSRSVLVTKHAASEHAMERRSYVIDAHGLQVTVTAGRPEDSRSESGAPPLVR